MRASLVRTLALTVAATLTTTLVSVGPAVAGKPSSYSTLATGAQSYEIDQAIARLEPHVSRSAKGGTFSLNAPREVVASIDADVFGVIVGGMASVNDMISAGLLTSTDTLKAYPVGVGADPRTDGGVGILSHGVNSFSCNWVYCTLRLSAFWTGKVIDALQVGATGAGLAAVLAAAGVFSSPGAVPSAVTAGILALGAGVIKLCSNSHGVWIRFGLGSWCGGQ